MNIRLVQDSRDFLTAHNAECARPQQSDLEIQKTVASIIHRVRTHGDTAISELAVEFGEPRPPFLQLPEAEIASACSRVPDATRAVLQHAAGNITAFAQSVMNLIRPVRLEQDGFVLGMDFRPIDRAGCYIPGGRHPLPSTALMTAITAEVAGVRDICIASPRLTDEVIYAGTLAGVSRFYCVGGAQAVAALAYGTESIPRVDLIAGPGNAYVTEAKRQLQGVVGIDMLAGPSEIAIIADDSGSPEWIALDLAAQLEHDPRARAFLFTTSAQVAGQVADQLRGYPANGEMGSQATAESGGAVIVVFSSLADCVAASDTVAPEHLHLHVREMRTLEPRPKNYGAVFVGDLSAVPFGDYIAGPNHTLPTGGSARFSGALNPLTFLRAQTSIRATQILPYVAEDTVRFAELEGLTDHAAAIKARWNH